MGEQRDAGTSAAGVSGGRSTDPGLETGGTTGRGGSAHDGSGGALGTGGAVGGALGMGGAVGGALGTGGAATPKTTCVPGADQTCNASPGFAAIYGHCESNGTCTCAPGIVIDGNGHCLAPDVSSGVCTPGLDTTCNANPNVSAIYGHCESNGSCTCKAGFLLDASGHCRSPDVSSGACTPGLDQTCNADPNASAIYGHCESNLTCTCKADFRLDGNGHCRAPDVSSGPCTPGLDTTCNPDANLSALYGHCESNGTCVCYDGFVLNPTTGKCKLAPPAGCTLGLDQTCNADPAASDVAGVCQDNGTCRCSSSYVIDGNNGKCRSLDGILNGTWLIGNFGAPRNHVSWVRFALASPTHGSVDVLDGSSLKNNDPLWNCQGPGTWFESQAINTIAISFPASCSRTLATYTFASVQPPPMDVPGATLSATIIVPEEGSMIGYKYPDAQCNEAMTSCTDPLP